MKKTSNSLKGDKALTQKTKKLLDTKVVTKTGSAMHGRSKLRKDKQPESTFCSGTTDGDQELMRSYQTNDGAWKGPEMADKQPLAGPGQYLKVQELGIMPDQAIGPTRQKDPLPQPKSETKQMAPVKSGEWTHHYDRT